jgi:hypothetical protein
MDAYVTFEQVEQTLTVRNPVPHRADRGGLRGAANRAGSGVTASELATIRQELTRELETAERTLVDQPPPPTCCSSLSSSCCARVSRPFLVIGALMAFLVKTGNGHRRRDIHLGVRRRDRDEPAGGGGARDGIRADPVAPGRTRRRRPDPRPPPTLFYVSYWLLSKMEVAKWNRFVKGKVQSALTGGSALALASVAFLAVFREGFETVLFLQGARGVGRSAGLGAGARRGSPRQRGTRGGSTSPSTASACGFRSSRCSA